MKTYQRKVARPQGATVAAASHARPNHAVAAAFWAVEGEVLILPTHAARETALTQLHFYIFKVECVWRRQQVQWTRRHIGQRARDAHAANRWAVVAEKKGRRADAEEWHVGWRVMQICKASETKRLARPAETLPSIFERICVTNFHN